MGFGGLCLCLMGMLRSHGSAGHYHNNHYYYRPGEGRLRLLLGVGTVGVGLTIMSSTVFAAVRRATGLTFRRRLLWPPVDVKTGEKWLKWYESRMVKINETAEARIATAIERYGGEIEDPAIREVWERQLREDVMEKVNRIKERQTCCADMLRQAKERELNPGSDDGRRRHSPILALYLYAGERCLDWLISWMRGNSHFCYEPGEANSLPGSVSLESLMGGYENGSGSASIAPTKSVAGEDIAIHVATRASPLPYIAVAQSRPLSPLPLSETMPEPSAPTLSESQFLKMVPPPRLPDTPPLDDYKTTGPSAESLSMATTSAHQGSRDAGRQAADSSEQQLRYEVLEPPPYTPVAGLDSESEQEPAIQNKEVRAIVADNESH